MTNPDEANWETFKEHVRIEEHLHIENNVRLQEGNERMARIEEDLRPLKNLYHAVIGAATVGGLLIGILIYVYQEDRATLKLLGEVLQRQGTTMEKLIQSHQNLERETEREFARWEKVLERLHPPHGLQR